MLGIAIDGATSLGWFLAALAIAAAYLASAYRDYDRLRAFRGPSTSGWTSLWLVRAVGSGQTNIRLAKVCEKYGEYDHLQIFKRDKPFLL
jgi:hypothetical protein